MKGQTKLYVEFHGVLSEFELFVEEVSMKKIPITYNIFFIDTSCTSVGEEEGPVYEEDTPATHLEKNHKIQQIHIFGK